MAGVCIWVILPTGEYHDTEITRHVDWNVVPNIKINNHPTFNVVK